MNRNSNNGEPQISQIAQIFAGMRTGEVMA
jgi:hypothetical protein